MRRSPRKSFAVTIVAPKRYLRMKRSLLQKDQILDVALRSTTVIFPARRANRPTLRDRQDYRQR
jgi:hypothetical protein